MSQSLASCSNSHQHESQRVDSSLKLINHCQNLHEDNGDYEHPEAAFMIHNSNDCEVERSLPDCNEQRITSRWDTIESSLHAQNTVNLIRQIVDFMNIEPNREKPLLELHIGDPTITGILPTHPNVLRSVAESLKNGRHNEYGPAVGYLNVRQELATFLNLTSKCTNETDHISANDIVLTSGCSRALQLDIEALGGPASNILVPRPGFPLCALTRPHQIEKRHYDLLMDKDWEADLHHLESLIDERTVAIVVNNPNNPTGAVYSREHLQDILRLAERYRVPIIADEIYGDMVFGGATFYPMHTLKPKVPMLTCDGISKRYLVPDGA